MQQVTIRINAAVHHPKQIPGVLGDDRQRARQKLQIAYLLNMPGVGWYAIPFICLVQQLLPVFLPVVAIAVISILFCTGIAVVLDTAGARGD